MDLDLAVESAATAFEEIALRPDEPSRARLVGPPLQLAGDEEVATVVPCRDQARVQRQRGLVLICEDVSIRLELSLVELEQHVSLVDKCTLADLELLHDAAFEMLNRLTAPFDADDSGAHHGAC